MMFTQMISVSQVSDQRSDREQFEAALNHGLAAEAVVAVELDESEVVDAPDDQAVFFQVASIDGRHQVSRFRQVVADEPDQEKT